jgi:transcriptional regulator with XRE-family HTH domain
MSTKKIGSGKTGVSMKRNGEIVRRIKLLRAERGENQKDFAKAMGVTQPMMSALEAGRDNPSPAFYLRLASVAPYPQNLWFWEQAGIDIKKLMSASGTFSQEQSPRPLEGGTVRIPRFRETLQGREEAGLPIPLPAEFIPNPQSTVCLVVDYKATAIVDSPQAVFILDESGKDAPSLSPFLAQVIFIEHRPESGIDQGLQAPPGIYMGRIRLSLSTQPSARMTFLATVRLTLLHGRNAPSPLTLARFEYDSSDDLAGIDRNLDNLLNDPRIVPAWRKANERALKEAKLGPDWRILGLVLGRLKLEGVKNG